MKETKYYCDMCGKEIEGSAEAKYIPIRKNVGKHGECVTKIRILDETYGGSYYMDFCEDCKGTIALLFGGNRNKDCQYDYSSGPYEERDSLESRVIKSALASETVYDPKGSVKCQ